MFNATSRLAILALGAAALAACNASDASPSREKVSNQSQHVDPSPCPDATKGETDADCPWAGDARALQDVAASSGDVASALEDVAPDLVSAIQNDASNTQYVALWGRSINFDELAKGIIVEPAIIDAINGYAGVPDARKDRTTHAGFEHTYGYLFSTLHTQFGYKRARWVTPDVEAGFGFTTHPLGPTPDEGTLLANVTYFAGSIALSDEPNAAAEVTAGSWEAASELVAFDFSQLTVTRLRERITLGERTVELRTDFVPFPNGKAASSENAQVLVYSVLDSDVGEARLVTAFPVADAFVKTALDPSRLGDAQPIVSRYNAWVDGVSDAKGLTGKREIVAPGGT